MKRTLSSTVRLRKPPLSILNISTCHFFQWYEIVQWIPVKSCQEENFWISAVRSAFTACCVYPVDKSVGPCTTFCLEPTEKIMKEMVAFHFQEAGGISLDHHVCIHTVCERGFILQSPVIQLSLIFILWMLSCLQGSFVKKLCWLIRPICTIFSFDVKVHNSLIIHRAKSLM